MGHDDPVRLIGLTGGIGSGKSSVSAELVRRGAVLVDADAIVKELQAPGQPVFDAMVERWGDRVVAEHGGLDRAAVAKIVFSDEAELRALEKLIHPEVRKESDRRVSAAAETDRVVILDLPLLAEARLHGGTGPDGRGTSATVVVDCPVDTAVSRLIEFRNFSEEDARARVAKQATREERRSIADFVIDNSGSEADLVAEVDRCWTWLETLEQTVWPPPRSASDQPA